MQLLADLTLEDYRAWERTLTYEPDKGPFNPYYDLPPQTKPLAVTPARMCTVSHCHKILPGHYKFRRCEEHRKQNRYHSNLKRVREKQRKAKGPGISNDWKNWTPANGDGITSKKDDKNEERLCTRIPIPLDRDPNGNDVSSQKVHMAVCSLSVVALTASCL